MDDETPSPKKSRREVEKRVVTVPLGKEAAPPTDTWAWRKYGQKPIKGSPYPRGYYRCSSWKGCPARKQVERSRVDPTMLVVTYSSDHNHPWPLPRNHNNRTAPPPKPPAADAEADPEGKFADLVAGDPGEFGWFSDVGSPSTSASPTEGSDDTLLYGSIAGCALAMLCTDEMGRDGEEKEDSLFAGLGELPECSAVFKRGLMAASVTAASTE